MTTKSKIGLYAEQLSAKYLESKGYDILDRNWRKPWGELDIVARREGILVFVEVKANSMAGSFFDPESRADWNKIEKVVRTSRTWLAYHKYSDEQEWQIDVVAVTFDKVNKKASIKHYKNIEV